MEKEMQYTEITQYKQTHTSFSSLFNYELIR